MYKSLFSAVNGNTQKKPYTYEKKSVSFQKETYERDFSFRVMQVERETIISLKRLFIYIHISFHVCRSLLTYVGLFYRSLLKYSAEQGANSDEEDRDIASFHMYKSF